jgi:hypothetical protein
MLLYDRLFETLTRDIQTCPYPDPVAKMNPRSRDVWNALRQAVVYESGE